MSEASDSQAASQQLSHELIAALAPLVVSRNYAPGETIVRQGEAGRALFIVRRGAAEVVIRDEEGMNIPLARFGPGSYFGEMSLLTGDPVSADVVALDDTLVSILPREDVEDVLARVPALGRHFAVTLANRLREANLSIWDGHRRQHALRQFLKGSDEEARIVGESRQAERLRQRVAELGEQNRPVLVVGEDGVGKTMVARCIHQAPPRRQGPMIAVDCSSLDAEEARELLFGSSDPARVGRYAQRLGYVHLAEGGTLLLERIEDLPQPVQADVAAFLDGAQEAPPDGPPVDRCLIATSRQMPTDLEGSNGLDRLLAERLAQAVVEVAPVRQRKRDILPLAEHFLAAHAASLRQDPKTLTSGAQRVLLSSDYSYGNVAELKEGLERAAQLSDGQVIAAEHIFLGPQATTEQGQYDLFSIAWLSKTVRSGVPLLLLRAAVFGVFGAIIGVCLLAADSRWADYANAAVWSVWWPLLLLSLLPAGRFWCAVCPISLLAACAQRLKSFGLPPPQWLKTGGRVAVLAGFVAIVWVEYVADMHSRPFATGLLLVTLMGLAAVVGLIFQRHSWCRYLCPLGGLTATVSVCSALRLRASRDVCATQCTEPHCYKGNQDGPGCPMFHHALFVDNSHHCKLCLECLKTCQQGSVRVVVQPPLRGVWSGGRIGPMRPAFSITLAGVALLLALSQWSGAPEVGVRAVTAFSMASVAALGLGLLALIVFMHLEGGPHGQAASLGARLCLAFAPLAWTVLLCYHLGTLTAMGSIVVEVGPAASTPTMQASLLALLYVGAVVVGAAMTVVAFSRTYRHHFRSGAIGGKLAWAACLLAAVAYAVVGFGSYLRGSLPL